MGGEIDTTYAQAAVSARCRREQTRLIRLKQLARNELLADGDGLLTLSGTDPTEPFFPYWVLAKELIRPSPIFGGPLVKVPGGLPVRSLLRRWVCIYRRPS